MSGDSKVTGREDGAIVFPKAGQADFGTTPGPVWTEDNGRADFSKAGDVSLSCGGASEITSRQDMTDYATVFYARESEILRLTKDGMYYKGQFIEDAGEAHKAFLEAMRAMQSR